MSKSSLRNAIGEYMNILGKMNDNVVIVNADLAGTCRNKSFIEEFPYRSFNTGIAEQNMVSFAAGLAHEGFIPYVFSMAPFLTMRACEQVRSDIAYGNRKVRLIGVYAGVSGGISGATHWAIEDVGILSAMPGIKIFEVSDANLAKRLLDYSLTIDSPFYIRCGVEPTEDIYDDPIRVNEGGSIVVSEGDDGAILCTGVVVQYAIEAAKQIYNITHKKIRVVDIYSLKPIDKNIVISSAKTGKLIVAQDHNIVGGLGSIVSTIIAENAISTNFRILGIPDEYAAMAHAPYLYNKFGYDTEGLTNCMLSMLED